MVLNALIGGERKIWKIQIAVCARETEIPACLEKMAAVPIPPVYSGHFFSIAVCVLLASL